MAKVDRTSTWETGIAAVCHVLCLFADHLDSLPHLCPMQAIALFLAARGSKNKSGKQREKSIPRDLSLRQHRGHEPLPASLCALVLDCPIGAVRSA
jgi:hypothetical protein